AVAGPEREVGHLGPPEGHVQLARQARHLLDDGAGADAGRRDAVDRGRRVHVVARDRQGAGAVLGADERAQRYHLARSQAGPGAHVELLEGIDTGAGAGDGLDVELTGSAGVVVMVRVVSPLVILYVYVDT